MTQLIFLDIDGVINSGTKSELEEPLIEKINKITKKTNASIVITSDRRYDWEECLQNLKDYGLEGNIIGSTPESNNNRGEEIKKWFYYHTIKDSYINYVILDDRKDILQEQMKYYININPNVGITDENVEKALSKLIIVQ